MSRLLASAFCALTLGVPAWGVTTYDSPANHVAGPGTTTTGGVNLDGIAQVVTSIGFCSGALLSGGMYVLTAAHCVDNGTLVGGATVNFFTASGNYSLTASDISVAPGWTTSLLDGSDLAILTLSSAFSGAAGYDIYRGTGEVGQSIELAGWGRQGTGATGYTGTSGTLRWGTNRYDTTGAFFGNSNSSILLADFDSGSALNDLFGQLSTGLVNAALTDSSIAPGDSGGPSFWNGLLVGIHSFNGRLNGSPQADIDGLLNSSFGELFGDTRISSNLAFIDSVLTPEPSAFALMGLGLVGLIVRRRKHQLHKLDADPASDHRGSTL